MKKKKYIKEDDRNQLFKIGNKVKPISKTTKGNSFQDVLDKMKRNNTECLEVTRIRDEKEDYIEDGKLVIWADTYDSGCGFPFYEEDLIKIKENR